MSRWGRGFRRREQHSNHPTSIVSIIKQSHYGNCILQQHDRILYFSEGLIHFKNHYRFEVDVCNPDAGNEKGNVENKVGYTRRNQFVPLPVIEEFEAYNRELLTRCDADHGREHYRHGVLIEELWREEQAKLLILPAYAYEIFRYEGCSVGKTGFVTVDKKRYGLSPVLAGKTVQAKIYYDRIAFFFDHQIIKEYPREYGKQGEAMDWRLYLPTLLRKPGAVEHTRFFGQMPKLWQSYLRRVQGRERKSALQLLLEMVNEGNDGLCDTVLELAGEALHGELDVDSIRQCYRYLTHSSERPNLLPLTARSPSWVYAPDLTAYNALLSPQNASLERTGGEK